MNYAPRGGWPYWFPRCYDSMLDTRTSCAHATTRCCPRTRTSSATTCCPQSLKYALDFRRFQIELMFADPRYTGYTINTVRDVPLVRAGLHGRPGPPALDTRGVGLA